MAVLPNPWKPSYSKESTVNTYAWQFQTIQVNSHVLPLELSNTSQFVPLFWAHEEVCGVTDINLSTLSFAFGQTFTNQTSGIYIRLSINFAKRAGKWGAQPQTNYNFNCCILFTFLPWSNQSSNDNSFYLHVLTKEKCGMISPWVEITSFMGAVLKKVWLTRGVEYPLSFVDLTATTLKQFYLCFQNDKNL